MCTGVFTAWVEWALRLVPSELPFSSIQLIFWSVDRIDSQPFHGKWLLVSSIIWVAVFFFLSRWRGITK